MAITNHGPVGWEGEQDDEGNRSYKIRFKVSSDSKDDGPHTMINFSGAPTIGDTWNYGNDTDTSVYCTPAASAKLMVEDEPFWICEYNFESPHRKSGQRKSQSGTNSNPLLEPPTVGGSFVERKKKIHTDRNGKLLQLSTGERVGKESELEVGHPTVQIGMNLASINLATITDAINKTNSNSMWGVGEGNVKFSECKWERRYYGASSVYYNISYDFDIDFDGWLLFVPNRCKKVIRGSWSDDGKVYTAAAGANPKKASDYQRMEDSKGHAMEAYVKPSTGLVSTKEEVLNFDVRRRVNFITTLLVPSSL